MRKKLVTLAATSLLVFAAGCGNQNEEGQQGTDNNNVEPVRFQNNDGENYQRNYTLQRDLEESDTYDGSPTHIRNIKNNNADNNGTNQNNNTDNSRSNNNQYDVAEEAADLIVKKVNGIDNAYVFTTDNNAYVAAEYDQKGGKTELTDEVKEQISKVVKSVDNNIENVYVSTNPDFMDLANNYANDVENGEPIEGFFEEMGNMIDRVFPENN